MNWTLYVARRHLRSRYSTGFISLITYFSIIGIAIGVAALIIVLSVMNGFEEVVRTRIIGMDAHIRLRAYHDRGLEHADSLRLRVAELPHVTGVSPYILEKGMIRLGNVAEPAVVRGVDPNTLAEVSDIQEHLIAGSFDLSPGNRNMILGRFLADKLACTVGDTVVVFSPSGITSMFSQPRIRKMRVGGIFELGMFEYDDMVALVHLQDAAWLFQMGDRVHGLEIRLDDLNRAEEVKDDLLATLGQYPYYPLTWFEMHRNLFSWMKIERWMMFTVLSLIIIVAAFNIITVLIMIVLERKKEIGILKAMGASRRAVSRIFLWQGMIIGLIGTLGGIVLGFLICWLQYRYEWLSLPPDVYFISAFPILMQWTDFLLIGVSSMLISLAATWYPARQAGRLLPVEAIRYE